MEDVNQDFVWTPPVYNMDRQPAAAACTTLAPDPAFPENFARSVKWCPDGSTALMQCENRSFQSIRLQEPSAETEGISNLSAGAPTSEGGVKDPGLSRFSAPTVLQQAEAIVDYTWFPRATIQDPASYCFIASVRESPVRLLDASDGRLRASYRIVDHRERQIAPHSLAFNVAADKLYCGFQDAIEVFDLNSPGEGTRLHTTPSRKSRDGLKGIISSIAFCPTYDPPSNFFAAGSLSPSSSITSNIALYTEDTGTKAVGWIGDVRASVMQLAFNPTKPHVLYSSFRRHGRIYSWDLRGDTSTPYQTFRLAGNGRNGTNQKMRFDIDISGKWLAVGSQRGTISIYNLEESSNADESTGVEGSQPVLEYQAHEDAAGAVSFHPLQPLLLSVSGSRHFVVGDEELSSSGSENDSDGAAAVTRSRARSQPATVDSSVRLWGFSG